MCAVLVEVQLGPTKPRAPQLKMPCEGKIHMYSVRFNKAAPEEVAELFGRTRQKETYC